MRSNPELDAQVAQHLFGCTARVAEPRSPGVLPYALCCCPDRPHSDDLIRGHLRPYSGDPMWAREVESEIERRGLQQSYLSALCGALGLSSDGIGGGAFDLHAWMNTAVDPDALWRLVHATPEQRCIAALRAVGVEVTL